MILPNADRAIIDLRKLRDYTLNPRHRIGRHKARLFAAVLGLTQGDAEALRDLLLQAVRTHETEPGPADAHGQRYRVDCVLTWQGRQAPIRSVWNVQPTDQLPHLVTCYPLKEG